MHSQRAREAVWDESSYLDPFLSLPSPVSLPPLQFTDTCARIGSLAMLEMQIVVPLFFRYFDVEVDRSMTVADVQMKEGFSGCPAGEKVVLNLQRNYGP